MPVDIKKLRNQQGALFQFFNHTDVTWGTYTGIRLVVSDNFNVIVAATNQGLTKQFPAAYSIGNGQAEIDYTFPSPLVINGTSKVVAVDFNLGGWQDNNGVVTPTVGPGSTTGVSDPSLQLVSYTPGFITNLVTGQAFQLSHGNFKPLNVLLDGNTVYSGKASSAAQLKNGQHIQLGAVWSETKFSMLASSIQVNGN